MITKITPRRYNTTQIAFKGYNTSYEDIEICDKNISSSVKSKSGDIYINNSQINNTVSNMSGDIDIENSKVNNSISNMSGDIYISSSKINGDISNKSGKIRLAEKTVLNGDIENISGAINLNKSDIKGNISTTTGKIILKDSNVKGIISSKPENIRLEGENKISTLILTGFKKFDKETEENIDLIKAKLAQQGIFIGSIKNVNYGATAIVNNFDNGKLVSTEYVEDTKPYEFKLPKGNQINTIKFNSDKKGTLILEKGTEFLGKLINGVIKRV